MDEQKAREIIRRVGDGSDWIKLPEGDSNVIGIDGYFDADTLEAFAWWLRNKPRSKCTPKMDGDILCALGDNCLVDCGDKDNCEWHSKIHDELP